MRTETSTWATLAVDEYIQDKAGTIWRVCAIDPWRGHVRVKNRDNVFATLEPKPGDTPVVKVIFDAPDEAAPYVALLRDQLGAEVIAQQDNATKVWRAPAWPADHTAGRSLQPYREHLELMHNMHGGDIKTFPKLVAAHEAAHDEDRLIGKHIPHTH